MLSPVVSTTIEPSASTKRAVGAGRVVMVALVRWRLDLVDVASGFGDTTFGANPRRGREVQLQLGVGEHHRTDVAALEHSPAALFGPLPLPPHQFGAHRAVGGDRADRGGDLVAADLGGRVDPVDQHAVLADLEVESLRRARRPVEIGRVDATAHRGERDGAVHRAGVEILEAEASRERPRDSALAGSGRTIDGNRRRTYQLVPCGSPSL